MTGRGSEPCRDGTTREIQSPGRAPLPRPPPPALPARPRDEPRPRHGRPAAGPGGAGHDRRPRPAPSPSTPPPCARPSSAASSPTRGARRRLRQERRGGARHSGPRLRLRRGGHGHPPRPSRATRSRASSATREAAACRTPSASTTGAGGDAPPARTGLPRPVPARRQPGQEQGDPARAGARRLRDPDPRPPRPLRLPGGEPLLAQHARGCATSRTRISCAPSSGWRRGSPPSRSW